MQPKREIMSPMDMQKWKRSSAYKDIVGFIATLNDSVKDTKLNSECAESSVINGLVELLNKLDTYVDETPPIQQPQRFGNKAFKTWYEKVQQNAVSILNECLPQEYQVHSEEISAYLIDSFGNSTRIDYGTGHEMNFLLFLICLFKTDALKQQDTRASILKVFNRYLHLARKLQRTYNMEPAGSHGVWSLDDFQFLPFIFGSSQLIDHKSVEPRHFIQTDTAELHAPDYMFFQCIQFINSVKTGPFAEHSNQLWNISAVPTWSKVNSGLMKMYNAEVLDKFPVVQHILFGSLITLSQQQQQQQ